MTGFTPQERINGPACRSSDPTDEFPRPEETESPARWAALASLAGALGIMLVMSIPHWTGGTYLLDDLAAFYFPMRVHYAECLARQIPFDWMPTVLAGFFQTGDGQVGGYHPVQWLLYRYLHVNTAFHAELLLRYPFMMVGTFLLFRPHCPRPGFAWFGAMVFTFSAFTSLHFIHPNCIGVVAHLPWLLAAIHLLATAKDGTSLLAEAGLAGLTASQLLLGYPQYVWFTFLAESAWCLFLFRGRRDLYVRLVWCKSLGALMGALQLLPTWDYLRFSVRDAPTSEFLFLGSWHPANLLQPLVPYLLSSRVVGGNTHEFALYAGAVPLILLGWIFLVRRPSGTREGLFLFLVISLILALIMSFGRYGGLAIVQTWLPLVGKFRVPARALLLIHLLWAGLTAWALSDMMTRPPNESESGRLSRLAWGLTGLSILITVLVPAVLPARIRAESISAWPWMAAGPLLVATGSWLVRAIGRGARWAVPVAILFTALDLGFYAATYTIFPRVRTLDKLGLESPPGKPGDRLVANPKTFGYIGRYATGSWFAGRGFTQVDGYVALEPRTRLFGASASLPALRAAGVRWVSVLASPAFSAGLNAAHPEWYEVPNPLPRLRLVTRSVFADDPSSAITHIDPATTVIVDEPISAMEGPPGGATLAVDIPGRLVVESFASTPQLAVLSDRYHPDWKASVNGRDVPIRRVNGDFMGWAIPAGAGRTVLEFCPTSVWWGWRITLAGMFLLGGYLLLRSRQVS